MVWASCGLLFTIIWSPVWSCNVNFYFVCRYQSFCKQARAFIITHIGTWGRAFLIMERRITFAGEKHSDNIPLDQASLDWEMKGVASHQHSYLRSGAKKKLWNFRQCLKLLDSPPPYVNFRPIQNFFRALHKIPKFWIVVQTWAGLPLPLFRHHL